MREQPEIIGVLIICAAIANIAWKFYIIFAVLNFAWFPVIYCFYPETAGLSLEEVDLMFKYRYGKDAKMSYKEAARMAKEETQALRREAPEKNAEDGSVTMVEHAHGIDTKALA